MLLELDHVFMCVEDAPAAERTDQSHCCRCPIRFHGCMC
jgi:hypothetical protein